jgi:hypothetical protein
MMEGTVQRIAQEKHDEHLFTRIRGVNLFACEAQNSVSANLETYISLSSFNLTTDLPKITNRSMNDFTISKASLVRLLSVTLSLFGIFIFTSPFLRVLAVLKAYGRKIMFIKMETHGKCESYLVASSDIDLESAIRCAYDLGSADKIGDTAISFPMELTKRATFGVVIWVFFPVRREVRN